MRYYIILVFATAVMSLQSIFSKQYNRKCGSPDPTLYTVVLTFWALLFFCVLSGGHVQVPPQLLPYAAGFGIAYAAALGGLNFAISAGPLSYSCLVNSYSLIIPTLYGIVILKDEIRITAYIGIALLCASIFLINKKKEEGKLSARWILYILTAFVGNGMAAVIQKMQQLKFNGAYKNEFMMTALAVAFLILALIALLQKKDVRAGLKGCWKYAAPAGVANGIGNLSTMILGARIPSAILFPTFSAGTMTIMLLASLFLYQEKLTKVQIVGYAIGILAICALNL